MKQKTYGKKSRTASKADLAIFTSSSPDVKEYKTAAPILRDKTTNFDVSSVRAQVVRDGHRTDFNEPVPKLERMEISPRIVPKSKKCRPRTPSEPHLAIDELAPVLEKLLIVDEDETKVVDKQHLRNGEQAAAKLIQHPAKIDAKALAYVSPLLGCKNVGDCVEDFQGWMDERSTLQLQKIGEGSFGEVYRATGIETVILKLIPLNPQKGRGSKSYTSVEGAASELQLLERMQKIPGFVEFRGACVLQGPMATQVVSLWNEYLESGRTVESKDPNIKGTYPSTQLWLLVEMSDAGQNLEPGQYGASFVGYSGKGTRYLSVARTWDIFWQVVKALAKAEVYAEFEHRDLHLGNICAKDFRAQDDQENLELVSRSKCATMPLNRTGMEVTLIDYSLSRAVSGPEKISFYDLKKDKHIFKGQGDFQYDIYRYMAQAVGEKTWEEFVPETNVLWLYYILEKLLLVTKELSEEARNIKKGKWTVTAQMRNALQNLEQEIAPGSMNSWELRSAGNCLDMAVERGWFLAEDVTEL